jgi:hypothetical protein
MHKTLRIAGCALACCLLAAASLSHSQDAQPAAKPAKPAVGTPQAPPQIYGKLLSMMEKDFVDLADAMPEDKFDFAPATGEFKGVRSFGAQVAHVAEANTYFFHDPSKPMVDSRADFEKLKTKSEIMKALKDSFAMAHAYVDAITPENAFVTTSNGTRAGMASFGLAHMMDHYGQLVVYLRMNGVVPPASRGGQM